MSKLQAKPHNKQSETFHQQCGNRMYESLVIQKALIDHLGEEIITVQDFEIRKEATSSITERGVGGLAFIVTMEETDHHGDLAVTVRNPHFGDEVSGLSDDIVEFIAKVIVQFCPKISLTVWSEYRCDGILFHGHPRFRSGQAWNDWAMIEWPTLVVGKDGESHIVNLDVEGQIYRFIDLQDPQSFDFDMFHNRLIPTHRKEDTPYMQSFILSKGLPLQLFPNLLSERVSLNIVTVMGAEN